MRIFVRTDLHMAVADPVISILVERFFSIAERQVTEEIKLAKGARDEVRKLSIKLGGIQSVLEDAEKRRVQEQTVKNWMKELEGIVCDMDDVIDEWQTRIIKKKIRVDKYGKKVNVLRLFNCFKRFSSRRKIALRVQNLNERLDFIVKSKDQLFNFLPPIGEDNSEKFKPDETTSLVDESRVCGRDADKKSLVRRLLSESSNIEQSLAVISIVGKGGSGKTTLAQLAFNNEQVNSHFDHKIWVYASNPVDEKQIAKTILTSLTNDTSTLTSLELMHREIHEVVSKRRILLVLDDVWSQAIPTWEQLRSCFKGVSSGSKVLITTRDMSVAKMMGDVNMLRLQQLLEEDCWLLIESIALAHVDAAERHNFEDIGRKISKKCQGLPLAAKVIGSILLFKETREQWNDVLNSKIWELEKVEKELFPHLYLSYSELTPALKRCFRYCSIFNKGETIEVDMLVRMWIAQGYLSSKEIQNQKEQRGYDYVEHLEIISFFDDMVKDKANGKIVSCKMHDIVHDFVQYLAKDDFLTMVGKQVEEKRGNDEQLHPESCRHLSVLPTCPEDIPPIGYNKAKLRTLSIERLYDDPNWSLPFDTLTHLKSVRVMKLNNCGKLELPKEIGKLTHLRFLDLSNNELVKLPDGVCDLCNLQSLYLKFCKNLTELPQRIDQLINLRHLVTDGSENLLLPQQIYKLTELQTLSQFVLGRGNEFRLLEKLNHISGYLHIIIFNQVQFNKDDAERAGLRNKHSVEHLRIDINEDVEVDVIEALHIPPCLHRLDVYITKNSWYPSWMMSCSLDNLRHLVFSGGNNCSSLPPLWQLKSLEILEITNTKSLKTLGLEFIGISGEPVSDISSTAAANNHGAFPKLKKLFFKSCEKWEVWEDLPGGSTTQVPLDEKTIIMPDLQELIIEDCINLKRLPLSLLAISKTRRVIWEGFVIESNEDYTRVSPQWYNKQERLKAYRQAAAELNARRRYQLTLELEKEEAKEEAKKQNLRKIRTHQAAIQAAYLFQASGPSTPENSKPGN